MAYIGAEPIVSATRTITEVTATAGQTVFTANGGYTVGYIDVFLNGAQLQTVDFTATNGTTITLTEAAQVGDVIRLVAWGTFSTAAVTPADVSDKTNTSTGAFDLPAGTTAQRPVSADVGYTRYNTTLASLEMYDGSFWRSIKSLFSATGGSITNIAGYRVHAFTTSGNFVITQGSSDIDYLIIAGGGGGGHGASPPQFSGGGAGGVIQGSVSLGVGTYSIVIGGGGTGNSSTPSNGANTTAFGLTAIGGGGGGNGGGGFGNSGGSGGGQGGTGGSGNSPTNASGTSGQGNAGGARSNDTSDAAGGGGGFSSAGQNGVSGTSGNGGAGLTSTITGSSVTYAGGGGRTDQGFRAGFSGSPSGVTNSGSGGAGSSGNGGSGIVIVRYLL